jgi:hypothetical protein
MVRVASVKCLGGFVVELGFTDGATRVIDLDRYVDGPVFQPHRADPAFFRSVKVDPDAGTIAWPNGTDLDPDVLRWGLWPVCWAPPREDERPPVISDFLGIAVRMRFDDHAPPHVRASYGEEEALVCIDSPEVLAGSLPRRALAFVQEWAALHRTELAEAWACAQRGLPPQPIAPLE